MSTVQSLLPVKQPFLRLPALPARLYRLGESGVGWLLLMPALVLLAVVVLYPVLKLLHDSFHDLRLSGSAGGEWLGLQHYADLLRDPDVHNAARNTLGYVLVTVPGALLAGLLLAVAANQPWRWRWPVRLALLLPWAMPMSFIGLIFGWFFHSEYGVVNDLLRRIGMQPVPFLLTPGWAYAAVCIASIWKASSFVALILLAGLQAIPADLYEAASVEGASGWQRFRFITLPLLLPSLAVATIFRTLAALQTFDIPYAMTQGGPARHTETVAMLIHQHTIDYLDVGYASALAVCLFLVSFAVSLIHLRGVYRKVEA